MPSFVWTRDPEEAYRSPYEHEANEQFMREAERFLICLEKDLLPYPSFMFKQDDRTERKAVWMLHLDALDGLRICHESLKVKNHRVAGRIFRTIIEALDLAAYFSAGTDASKKDLGKWYGNEVIPHRQYRAWLKKTYGNDHASNTTQYYRAISKFSHRTYHVLLKSYLLGSDGQLVYDGSRSNTNLVLPHTISAYMAIHAELIQLFAKEASRRGYVLMQDIERYWAESLEPHTPERRFSESIDIPPHSKPL